MARSVVRWSASGRFLRWTASGLVRIRRIEMPSKFVLTDFLTVISKFGVDSQRCILVVVVEISPDKEIAHMNRRRRVQRDASEDP
ncbi:hypothetical protein HacjB3_16971 (plasmid) [Halalkalicoccus jeotgali B3]|uniref:Uncharacterized protein n=2 Tax=Halalkalicoccus jeotgali (strain DSM 18796 / CECT 7217 / JCM 14584 / KCTC 4019 / B3) TaxID=795797 RepID=D8JBU1_HALJB|nr:hypothetical protein HacjB3_16971 [Halalkalicoccus jeotgali B3]